MRIILFNDVNIFDRTSESININEFRTFNRDKVISNGYEIEVQNYDNFFSVDNPDSYFSGIQYRYGSIKIFNDDNDLIWDGIIKRIKRDPVSKTASIETINILHKFLNRKVVYKSSDWETPANAAINIMDTYLISYNTATINRSSDIYTDAGCKLKCNFLEDDGLTVIQALEKLGEFGCADVYSHLNEIYFKVYQSFTGGAKVSLTESQIVSMNEITDIEEDIVNQYSIGYDADGGTPLTDIAGLGFKSRSDTYYGDHSLPEMDSSSTEGQIAFENIASAKFIGESYMKRTHRDLQTDPKPLTKINFDIKATNKDWVDIETFFTLNFSDENWTNKTFEIFEFTLNEDSNLINITAMEIAS